MKLNHTLITLFILGFAFMPAPSMAEVSASEFNDYVKSISNEIDPDNNSDAIDNSVLKSIFENLKRWGVKAFDVTAEKLASIKNDVLSIGQNLSSMKNSGSVTVSASPEGDGVSLHYRKHLPGEIADELGLDRKWEIYEVQLTPIHKSLNF